MTDILAWVGTNELLVILAICILIFGKGRIPKIARSLGLGIKEFKKASKEITDNSNDIIRDDIKDDDTTEDTKDVSKDD